MTSTIASDNMTIMPGHPKHSNTPIWLKVLLTVAAVQLLITASVLTLQAIEFGDISELQASLTPSASSSTTNWAFDCSAVARLPAQTSPEPTWDINLVTLEAVPLGNGAYALVDSDNTEHKNDNGIAAPTSGGFIVTPGGIVVIETYLNRFTACSARSIIEATAPSVPIKYVLCTSNHGDHCYGNSVFLAPGVKFVMHQNTYFKMADPEHLQADKAFMMNAFGYAAGIQATTPITPDMTFLLAGDSDLDLSLGGDVVTAKYFGRAQTSGDLFVWHPRSGSLYTGNPVIADGPTMPWLLDGDAAGALQVSHTLNHSSALLTPIWPLHAPNLTLPTHAGNPQRAHLRGGAAVANHHCAWPRSYLQS